MKTKTILDDEQLAAYNRDQNVVVSAGAGSGKTTVLSHRYVRLVQAKHFPVDSIVTLTFTRKAAAEMFNRIYQELAKINDSWVQEQLQRFDTARIDTLDSFCASIVRTSCQNYGIPPNFTIDEKRLKNLAEQTAMEFLMEHRSEAVVSQLVASYSFDSIVTDFLADFCQYHLPMVNCPSFRELARKQEKCLLSQINDNLRKLSVVINEGAALDKSSGKSSLVTIVNTFASYTSIPQTYSDPDQESLESLCTAILTIRKPGKVKEGTDLGQAKELLTEAKELCTKLKPLIAFYAKRNHIQKMGELLDELAGRFNQKKRNEALLSFGDLIDLAVDILKSSLPLRNYYKSQIRAIMIDEFQDNNEKQKELLYLLAEDEASQSSGIPQPEQLAPDKLFFVGDEKQSIYRFRGADVSVFKRLSEELQRAPEPGRSAGGGNPLSRQLSIRTNYRSEPELIEFFNSLFPGIFDAGQEKYEASYIAAKANPEKEPTGTIPVELFIIPEESEDDTEPDSQLEGRSQDDAASDTPPAVGEPEKYCTPAETEAMTAARRIIQGITDGEFNVSDVALLFRTTTHQSVYERVFRTVGIPFVSADPRGLFLDAPANDFYAMLQLVLFPQDKNAYATVLRSPFVNLSDGAFLKLMLEIKTNHRDEPFIDLPADFWLGCEGEDRTRYTLGTDLYRTLSTMADTRPIADLMAWLWYDTGYRTSSLTDSDMAPTLGHFQLLYDLAIQADQRHLTLAAFLEELAPLIGNPEKIEGGEADKAADAVTFMTIHKCKGLQFPIVIIPQAGSKNKAERNEKPYFYSDDFGPVISWKAYSKNKKDKIANPLFEALRNQENTQNLAEFKRLLYVALTRAERKVIMVGSRKDGLSPHPAPDTKKQFSFYDFIAQGIQEVPPSLYKLGEIGPVPITERGRELSRLRSALTERLHTLEGPRRGLPEDFYRRPALPPIEATKRITSPTIMERVWQQARPEESATPPAPQLRPLAVDSIIAASSKDLETLFGTLCHRVLQNKLEGLEEALPLSLLAALKEAGLSKETQKLFIDEASRLAHQFIEGDLGRAALNAKPLLRTEYGFLLPLYPPELSASKAQASQDPRPILVKGSMDLIFETDSHCFIIDFKTDKVRQSEAHRIQLESYRRAGQAFSDKPARTMLVYLRDMVAEELTPRISDTELYQIAQESLKADEAIQDILDEL